jgi:hypothetical protein
MATAAHSSPLAAQARRAYADALLKGLPGVVRGVDNAARELLAQPADRSATAA